MANEAAYEFRGERQAASGAASQRHGAAKAADRPAADEVARQLSAILGSRRFRRSPVLCRILVYVTNEALRGSPPRCDATSIARFALGKEESFKSHKDASVRVALNRLRTALALYYANEGGADDVVIELKPGSHRPEIAFRRDDQGGSLACEALTIVDGYQNIINPRASALALRALRAAMQSQPESPALLAAYTDLCLDAYKFRLGTVERALDEAAWALKRAQSLEPENPVVVFQSGMFSLVHNDLDTAANCGHRLTRNHSTDPGVALQGAWLLAHTADPTLIAQDHDLCPQPETKLPGWINHARFLASYHAGDYEAALSAAIDFGMPNFFWGAIDRTAALAQLGLQEAAGAQLTRLLHQNPLFVKEQRWHLAHHIKHEDALAHVLEGLHKAGLQT